MTHPKTVILHGKQAHPDEPSPRKGREYAELWMGYMGVHDDWTRRFDPHPVEHTKHYPDGIKGRRPEVWEYYKSLPPFISSMGAEGMQDVGRPIYLLDATPDVPASATYPLESIPLFPYRQRLTCTVDMQMVLALGEGFEHVILHNIGLITDDWETTALNPEWQMKHKGILYWIGFLEAADIKVTIEGDSIFAVPDKLYGYETCGRDFGVAQRRYIKQRVK
jgi:hypothetical protein